MCMADRFRKQVLNVFCCFESLLQNPEGPFQPAINPAWAPSFDTSYFGSSEGSQLRLECESKLSCGFWMRCKTLMVFPYCSKLEPEVEPTSLVAFPAFQARQRRETLPPWVIP